MNTNTMQYNVNITLDLDKDKKDQTNKTNMAMPGLLFHNFS